MKIYFSRKSDSPACDHQGRRYGAYTWLMVSFGNLHFVILPAHVRRVWRGGI